jgi:hypothetical protein
MLARQNIGTVVIEEEESRTPQEVEEEFQTTVGQLEARFIRVVDSPILMALKKTMLYMAKRQRDDTLAVIEKLKAASENPEAAQPSEPTGTA